MASLKKKLESSLNRWKNHHLKKLKSDNYRFKVKVVFETALAYQIQLDDLTLWAPKKISELGIDPTGHYYAIDLPKWYCEKNKLI